MTERRAKGISLGRQELVQLHASHACSGCVLDEKVAAAIGESQNALSSIVGAVRGDKARSSSTATLSSSTAGRVLPGELCRRHRTFLSMMRAPTAG